MYNTFIYENPSSLQKDNTKFVPYATINVTDNEPSLTYFFIDEDGNPSKDFECKLDSETRMQIKKDLGEKLKAIAATNDEYSDDRLATLRAYLEGLFDKIIPPDLGNIIRKWDSEIIINITTNEQWIPWELLHDGNGYLGQRFMIFRLPRITRNNCNRRQHLIANGSKKKLIHIVGGGIGKDFTKKAKNSFNKIKKEGVDVEQIEGTRLIDLSKKINQGDILHFTCHGHVNPCYIQLNEIDNADINLTIEYIKSNEFEIKEDCFIFANACSSADASIIFGEFSNFGAEFYKKGSIFFIGTLGSIPTEFAIDFAKEFYNTLSRAKNIHLAFTETKKRMSIDGKIFINLYIIYGNPRYIWTIS